MPKQAHNAAATAVPHIVCRMWQVSAAGASLAYTGLGRRCTPVSTVEQPARRLLNYICKDAHSRYFYELVTTSYWDLGIVTLIVTGYLLPILLA